MKSPEPTNNVFIDFCRKELCLVARSCLFLDLHIKTLFRIFALFFFLLADYLRRYRLLCNIDHYFSRGATPTNFLTNNVIFVEEAKPLKSFIKRYHRSLNLPMYSPKRRNQFTRYAISSKGFAHFTQMFYGCVCVCGSSFA